MYVPENNNELGEVGLWRAFWEGSTAIALHNKYPDIPDTQWLYNIRKLYDAYKTLRGIGTVGKIVDTEKGNAALNSVIANKTGIPFSQVARITVEMYNQYLTGKIKKEIIEGTKDNSIVGLVARPVEGVLKNVVAPITDTTTSLVKEQFFKLIIPISILGAGAFFMYKKGLFGKVSAIASQMRKK